MNDIIVKITSNFRMRERVISVKRAGARVGSLTVVIWIWILSPPPVGQAQDAERPEVHADFEFSSFPYSHEAAETFSAENVRMLMAAFAEGWSVDKFVKETETDLVETLTLLDEFENVDLVVGPNDYSMRPRLPVIREPDLIHARPGMEMDAAALLDILDSHWSEIEEFVGTLDAARDLPTEEILYQVIVGGIFLGGLVDALYEDQTLMPPPPRRGRRGDGYYAWMIEGEVTPRLIVQQAARVGRYEVRSVGPVVEENPRIQIDTVAESGPVYESEDARRWRVFVSVFSRDYLLPYIKSRRSGLIEITGGIEASRYTALAELFVWYYHSVVARVADFLVDTGRVELPESSYRYALRSAR